jgi:hypothetical protein
LLTPELIEVRRPGGLVGKDPLFMLIELLDHLAGEVASAHAGERFGVDDIVALAGPGGCFTGQLHDLFRLLGPHLQEPEKVVPKTVKQSQHPASGRSAW